jgi:hypothetical protein
MDAFEEFLVQHKIENDNMSEEREMVARWAWDAAIDAARLAVSTSGLMRNEQMMNRIEALKSTARDALRVVQAFEILEEISLARQDPCPDCNPDYVCPPCSAHWALRHKNDDVLW